MSRTGDQTYVSFGTQASRALAKRSYLDGLPLRVTCIVAHASLRLHGYQRTHWKHLILQILRRTH